MDVFDIAQLAGADQLFELFESRVETQHMADHENALVLACGGDGAFGIGDRQCNRLFNQYVLASFNGLDRHVRVILRRQRHHDGIYVVARKQIVRLHSQTIMLDRETFRASGVHV